MSVCEIHVVSVYHPVSSAFLPLCVEGFQGFLLELKPGDVSLDQGLFKKILRATETPAGVMPDDPSLSSATHSIKAGFGGSQL